MKKKNSQSQTTAAGPLSIQFPSLEAAIRSAGLMREIMNGLEISEQEATEHIFNLAAEEWDMICSIEKSILEKM